MAFEFIDDNISQEELPENEGLIGGTLRNTARQASNLATRGVGLAGDVMSLVNEYIANPTVEAFGGKKVPYEKTLLGKFLPTTESHRAGFEEGFGEYLKPKNEIEKFVDNVVEDTALLLVPGAKAAKGAKTAQLTKALPREFTKSLGANIVAKAASDLGGEKAGNYTKMGTLYFLSLIDAPGAAKQLSQMYKTAEKNLPANAVEDASYLTEQLSSLKQQITKGRPEKNLAPSETFVINEINKIENLIKNGEINISQAWAQKRSINENLQSLFNAEGGAIQQRAKELAKPLPRFLNQTLDQYGKKNPKFYKPFKEADEGFSIMAQSNFFSNWIENNVKYNPLTSGLIHLFGSGLPTKAAAAIAPYQVVKVGYRIAKSPALRKIYSQAMGEMAKKNIPRFTKLLQELDSKIQEEENQDQYEFID